MIRIPVVDKDNKPLMPTKPSKARKLVRDGKAIGRWNKLGQYYIQLAFDPSGTETQPITIGLDPGKSYSGIGVQSQRATLFTAHLVLPFKTVKDRIEQRAMMRRGRRGRRINRKLPFTLRSHRQKRFNNRRGNKLAPSIKASRQLEIRVISELAKVFPITSIVFEQVKVDVDLTSGGKKARSGKGFSPVMVGYRWAIEQLSLIAPVKTLLGYETANLRRQLRLTKDKKDKSKEVPATHAVDGVALACSQFIRYQSCHTVNSNSANWVGDVTVTPAPFTIIRRPPISRKQLHLMVFAKGGIRRKYGGTVTRHGLRKGDYVVAQKKDQTYYGWVSGDTATQISVSDIKWKRIAQFSKNKVKLIQRSTGLICKQLYGGAAFLPQQS